MHLYPWRLRETSDWLNTEWQRWKETPTFKDMGEPQLMEIFLDVVKAVGSSIDEAYIDAWHEQQTQQT